MDYRQREYRREGFLRYYYAILKTDEYDPAYYTMQYLVNRYELNSEQVFWFSWLYGFIYNVATAWVVLNEFPDFHNAGRKRLENWERGTWRNMMYETDTRYKKGKIHQAFPYYRATIGDRTQEAYFRGVCKFDDPRLNFRALWDDVRRWKLFGRYSAFFYLETLKRVAGLPIECDSLFLRDISGSKSHRNGLLFSLGADELVDSRAFTPAQFDWMEAEADGLMDEMKARFPDVASQVDYFTAETAWCAYKGLFRKRRYFGYYLDRDAGQIVKAQQLGWSGIDWGVFWQCREESLLPAVRGEVKGRREVSPALQRDFVATGRIQGLGLFFPGDYAFEDASGGQFRLF